MTWRLDRCTAVDDVVPRSIQVSYRRTLANDRFLTSRWGRVEDSGSLIAHAKQGAVDVDVFAHERRRSRCLDLQLEPPALPLALCGSSRMVRRTAGRRGGGPDGGVHRGTTVVRAPRRRLRATGLGGRAGVVMRLGTERIPRDAVAGVPRRPRRACAPSRPPCNATVRPPQIQRGASQLERAEGGPNRRRTARRPWRAASTNLQCDAQLGAPLGSPPPGHHPYLVQRDATPKVGQAPRRGALPLARPDATAVFLHPQVDGGP